MAILRIANLNADPPVPNVVAQHGSYGDIFHKLLQASATRIAPDLDVQAVNYDVFHGEYPSSLDDFDVVLVTGSAKSSYDTDEWIRRLDDYLLKVYKNQPHIRLFGSCFGHQIICQSLLRSSGVIVEKDPSGWELGVREVMLETDFVNRLGAPKPAIRPHSSPKVQNEVSLSKKPATGEDSIRFQFIHSDHVKIPEKGLPAPWIPLGRSKHCAVQGVYEPARVLTYQGHFEFDRFINTETVKVFGAKWDPAVLEKSVAAMDMDDDSDVAADMVIRFFIEKRNVIAGDYGMLTPPLEA